MSPSTRATEVEALAVHRGDRQVGLLERTQHGASFEYVPDVAASEVTTAQVCFRMPVRAEPYVVRGVNLHPFFAGLLPEGLRFNALVRRAKTSEDDLFTLLAIAGGDAIGDVWIASPDRGGPASEGAAALPDPRSLSGSSFAELLATNLAEGEPVSVAGVHPKISAARITLPLRGRRGSGRFLLKLAPPELVHLVENEAFFMGLAREAGIAAAKCEIVRDREGTAGLLVERFDRTGDVRLHQEDALQLLDRYPSEKYRTQLQEIMEALDVCSAPTVERLRLLERQAFAYLIADGDLHAKNVSVLSRDATTRLSPAYDVLSTLPYGDERMAMKVEGRDLKLSRKHFVAFGERNGLKPKAIERMLDGLVRHVGAALPRLEVIGLDARRTVHLRRVMTDRIASLTDG